MSKNRNLYKIEKCEDCCIVYRVDNNYGRQGVVYKNGTLKREYSPGRIPNYIYNECLKLLNE